MLLLELSPSVLRVFRDAPRELRRGNSRVGLLGLLGGTGSHVAAGTSLPTTTFGVALPLGILRGEELGWSKWAPMKRSVWLDL